MLQMACKKSEINLAKIGFLDSKWFNLNAAGSCTPLTSFTFGAHYGVPFSLHAGKGKCCMWIVNKVEILFAKIGCLDSNGLSAQFWDPSTPFPECFADSCAWESVSESRRPGFGDLG